MRYFGGKAKIGKEIAEYINSVLKPNQLYLEPFVGGAWITYRIRSDVKRIASDLCPELIDMYNSLQKGWTPPSKVSKNQYLKAKEGKLSSELTAFIGFGCSFGGKWFGGYANTPGRNYALNAKNSLEKKMKNLSDVTFYTKDYKEYDNMKGFVIYCDPPYKGATGYGAVKNFDTEEFWNKMREWSEHNIVLISEYSAPSDFEVVLIVETKTDMHCKKGQEKRVEKLFQLIK